MINPGQPDRKGDNRVSQYPQYQIGESNIIKNERNWFGKRYKQAHTPKPKHNSYKHPTLIPKTQKDYPKKNPQKTRPNRKTTPQTPHQKQTTTLSHTKIPHTRPTRSQTGGKKGGSLSFWKILGENPCEAEVLLGKTPSLNLITTFLRGVSL